MTQKLFYIAFSGNLGNMFLRKIHFCVHPFEPKKAIFDLLRGCFWPKTWKKMCFQIGSISQPVGSHAHPDFPVAAAVERRGVTYLDGFFVIVLAEPDVRFFPQSQSDVGHGIGSIPELHDRILGKAERHLQVEGKPMLRI